MTAMTSHARTTTVDDRATTRAYTPSPPAEDPPWRILLDRILAVMLLIAAAPIMLVVALLVKLECPKASVLYKQVRVGRNRRGRRDAHQMPTVDRRRDNGAGEPFEIYKFRSMIPDAELRSGPVWATADDPRITRLGRILRRSRIDELPQLFNIIKGDMRLIGPRPERPHFVAQLTEKFPDYPRRLTVAPGLTGLSQVELEYDSDLDDVRTKLRYDLFYIDRRSAILDLKILLKTAAVVIRRRGAH